jgi:hypothetical protein
MNKTGLNIKAEIFELLRLGKFICDNSRKIATKRQFKYLEKNFEALSAYYGEIGIELRSGNGFYYFTRQENNQDLERKIQYFAIYIDILDICYNFALDFGAGKRFQRTQLEQFFIRNERFRIALEEIMQSMNRQYVQNSISRQVNTILNKMVIDGYIELEDEDTESYLVLSAWNYLNDLVQAIHINQTTEEDNETATL